jgi:alkaline phosphatase
MNRISSRLARTALLGAVAAALLCLAPVLTAAHAAGGGLYSGAPAKYVFFFIGDGMGIPQRAAASAYSGKTLVMDTFPAQGLTTTRANDRFITGSAASATALASGTKTNINYIGVDPQFRPLKTVAELAKEKGMKVGIVSSVSIDHATPAAFYAHVKTRKMYHEIDHALAESGFDYFGGGGLKDPKGKKSDKPLGDAIAKAKANGYRIVTDKDEFMQLTPRSGKVLAWNDWLQDSGALPYVIDSRPQDITLSDFTAKGIELLENPKGFFMMVEGGKIDWACHANDATSALTNNLEFDKSVQLAVDFAKKHPNETLILVTGDHECGGLTLGFAGTKYQSFFDVLSKQNISYVQFDQDVMAQFKKSAGKAASFDAVKPLITKHFGLRFAGDPAKDRLVLAPFERKMLADAFRRSVSGSSEKSGEEEYLLYGEYDPMSVTITHILNQKAGLGWTSYKHTGVPVSTSAMGVGAETFNGMYDNTDVAKKVMAIMGVPARVHIAER